METEILARKEDIVDGLYRLGPLIRRSVASATYETEFGEAALPAVIKICDAESPDSVNLILRLRNAGELAHPNLLNIYATGFSAVGGAPIAYIVMERADETLQAVLAHRALTQSETREMLGPVVHVLKYLHNKGYAHTRLKASNVLAVKDQLKLSSDSVAPMGHGPSGAEDMRALAILIVQALTQKVPTGDEISDAQTFAHIPQPLGDIVRHCLDPDSRKRWTAEQVAARLNAPAIHPVPRKPELLRVPSRLEEQDLNPGDSDTRIGSGNQAESRIAVPKWIYVGLAAVVLIVLVLAVVRRKNSGTESTPPVPAATQQDSHAEEAGAPTIGSGAAVANSSPAVTPPPRVEPTPARATGVDARKANGWSVIVGAYVTRESAEKRMRELARRWPAFQISLLEPRAEKMHYFLVLGQNLSEDQAEALRKRAVQTGLPRDTYIKRVM